VATGECSSHCDICLCSSHCHNRAMFVTLQCLYMFITLWRYNVCNIATWLCSRHCEVGNFLSHFDARICVPHCNMRKCSSHSDDMTMCNVCLCSSQCDVTNQIARTWLCSSHCDVNLCFSQCDVSMLNIL